MDREKLCETPLTNSPEIATANSFLSRELDKRYYGKTTSFLDKWPRPLN